MREITLSIWIWIKVLFIIFSFLSENCKNIIMYFLTVHVPMYICIYLFLKTPALTYKI